MKKSIFLFATMLIMAACNPPTDNQSATTEEAANVVADTISTETMQTNLTEVQAFLKECGVFFIATTDANQPHVRPFGVAEIIDGKLYIMTGKKKDVYKQISNNQLFEICALNMPVGKWLRINGKLVADETLQVKEEILNRNENLKAAYKADDDNMAVLYISNGTARFCSFSEPERVVRF